MSKEKIAEVKLACLKIATERCATVNPGDILKIAKEYYDWIISFN